MTFVAQSYSQFVDDLLTSLTGGIIREEHRFIGAEEQSYSLAYPGATESSIKVFGQRNGAFINFVERDDYSYVSDEGAIVWNPEGNLPDDNTFFYINYYLQESSPRLTDRNPGSVTRTLAESFAREFSVLHRQMEEIYKSAFVDLATGASLEHVAALLSLARKDARFANGEVLFKRSTPAQGDITISAGTLVSTNEGQVFETTDRRTMRRGQLSVTVPIRAQLEGPEGQVVAGFITNVNRPIFGIESVTNEEASFFANAKETDEELRRRIKGELERSGKATINSIKFGLIEDLPEINEGNIQVTENTISPGRVEVRFGLEGGQDDDLVQRIEESIFNSKAAGVRVTHNLRTQPSPELEQVAQPQEPVGAESGDAEESAAPVAENSPRQNVAELDPEVLSAMPEGLLPLQVEAFLELSERNISASEKEAIQDNAINTIAQYIDGLPMGANLIYNKLLGLIVRPEDVSDASLKIGVITTSVQYQANIATNGRKTTIDPGRHITIGLMQEIVFIDIFVMLSESGSGSANIVTQPLKEDVKEAIENELINIKDRLVKSDLRKIIRDSIERFNSELLPIETMELSAEYEETGRLLANTEEISLEPHHVLQLRGWSIEQQGVLDG